MRNGLGWLVFICAVSLGPAHAQHRVGPSFDCGKPAEPLAALICGDPALSRVDLAYVQAFSALRHQRGPASNTAMGQESLKHVLFVIKSCGLSRSGPAPVDPAAKSCVTYFYGQQRAVWLSSLGRNANEEASRALDDHVLLQAALQLLNLLPADSKIDGVYGPATRAAIMMFQSAHSIDPTGFMDDYTASVIAETVMSLGADERAGQAGEQQRREADQASEAQRRRDAQAETDHRTREQSDLQQRRQAEQLAADRQAEQAAAGRRAAEQAEIDRLAVLELRRIEAERLAERQRREELDRRAAMLRNAEQRLGGTTDAAVLLVHIGREGGRLRRTLKGEIALMNDERPAQLCTFLPADTPAGFIAAFLAAQPFRIGLAPMSVAPCTAATLATADAIVVHRLGDAAATTEQLAGLIRVLDTGSAEPIARYTAADWRDGVARQRALSQAIRDEATDGSLHDWALLTLEARPGPACLVGAPAEGWMDMLRSLLPPATMAAISRVDADPDPERALTRLLSGQCSVLALPGDQAGAMLRALEANHRPVEIVPVRLSATTMARVQSAR